MKNAHHVSDFGTAFTELLTWRNKSRFSYRYDGALSLRYGNGRKLSVSAEKMDRLRAEYRGKIVSAFGNGDSLDAWARINVTPTRIASYLVPVLLDLGFAQKTGEKIRFPD